MPIFFKHYFDTINFSHCHSKLLLMPFKKQRGGGIKKMIATTLPFESNESALKNQLCNSEMDWELLVKASSHHGVITSVFCQLK